MENVRIISIPDLVVVTSGAIRTMEELDAFDRWWSSIDTKQFITPRDFMWFNEEGQYMEWIFAVPDNYYTDDLGDYQLTHFKGGLYAVATSRDTEEDCNAVREEIRNWVTASGCYEVSDRTNDKVVRYTMNHVITPKSFKDNMGYHLSDNFVPIVDKNQRK